MIYAKFINENSIEIAPRVLRDDAKTYSNPLPETLANFGYLPLIETEMPVQAGYYFTKYYKTNGDTVTVAWEKHENPVEPEYESENEQETTEPTESENESAE